MCTYQYLWLWCFSDALWIDPLYDVHLSIPLTLMRYWCTVKLFASQWLLDVCILQMLLASILKGCTILGCWSCHSHYRKGNKTSWQCTSCYDFCYCCVSSWTALHSCMNVIAVLSLLEKVTCSFNCITPCLRIPYIFLFLTLEVCSNE